MKHSSRNLKHHGSSAEAVERVTRRVYSLADDGQFVVEAASYDRVIIEAPLQILLAWHCPKAQAYTSRPLMITMRTPGQDLALVRGLLLASDIIKTLTDITQICHLEAHTIEVTLAKNTVPDWSKLERQGLSSASCGVCGQQQIKQLAIYKTPVSDSNNHWLSAADIVSLPEQLKRLQPHFKDTGGVHAAGLWQQDQFLTVHEDVGRHNAVDKVVGSKLALTSSGGLLVQTGLVLVLSGRVSFELVQKAIMADIPVIVAVGAPSSLAIALAKQFNISLIGFTKPHQFNLYCGEFRIV